MQKGTLLVYFPIKDSKCISYEISSYKSTFYLLIKAASVQVMRYSKVISM